MRNIAHRQARALCECFQWIYEINQSINKSSNQSVTSQ